MYRRCLEKHNKKYHLYGGRGITICDEWNLYKTKEAFKNFLRDLGPRPEGLTLERKNSNESYSKENCVWADYYCQNNNRPSFNRVIEFSNETLTLANWSKKLGIKYTTLDERIKRGWSVEKAFTTPVKMKENNG